jgi:glycosidase
LIYEVHTRQWLHELGARDLTEVGDAVLDELARLGVTYLWLMGIWPTGPRAREEARGLATQYDEALPGWTDDDLVGSPYAIAAYEVGFGGDAALAALRARLASRGIRVLLDFVPNHVGLDHPWTVTERVMHDGTTVVHGKDPYFPGWTDTAQLEYRRAATRAAMRDVLAQIATRCDGVRCDMAMLVLPDVFTQTWAHVPCEEFAADFWGEAIREVKRAHPAFVFVAEAYWGLEARLVELGFDFAYDKELYDRLVHDRPTDAAAHVRGASHARIHFLENHDEPRVAALPLALHRAAALVMLALPGLPFVHHGQLAGARRFARIQLGRRLVEPVDAQVHAMYEQLLAVPLGDERRVLTPLPAWDGNPTHEGFVIVQCRADLVVVNLAPHLAQCRVQVAASGRWILADRLGTERWERDLDEPLFLDLPPRGTQVFALQRPVNVR